MFNIRLRWYWLILALVFIAIFVYFVISPALNGDEPDARAFIICWFIGFIFVFIALKKFLGQLFNECLPAKYNELKMQFGEPVQSFKVSLRSINWLNFRNTFFANARFEIYPDFFMFSAFGRACIIKNVSDILLSESFLSGCQIEIQSGDSRMYCSIAKQQYEHIKSYLENGEKNFD